MKKDSKTADLRQRLDQAIKNRETAQIETLARLLLKTDRGADSKIFVSNAYRRISQYHRALEVLDWNLKARNWSELSSDELRVRIQTARILNLLGASSYALKICAQIDPEKRNQFSEFLAPILLSNYQFHDALQLSQAWLETKGESPSYTQRIRTLMVTDSLAGLNRNREAISHLQNVIEQSQEKVLLGICYQAQAEYYLNQNDLKAAQTKLNQSLAYFSKNDRTDDFGNLMKSFTEFYARLGKNKLAAQYFERSWKILYRPGLKPEPWLELLFWKGYLKKDKGLPIEWKQILAFPMPNQYLCEWVRKEVKKLPAVIEINNLGVKKQKEVLDIHSDTKELIERSGSRFELGLKLSDRLLAYLLATGNLGIPQFRIQEILWPEDLLFQGELSKRLEQLVIELRKKGNKIIWKNRHLVLTQAPSVKKVIWRLEEAPRGVLFLEKFAEFKRSDVEHFFGLSKSAAHLQCQIWLQSGHVTQSGKGRALIYRSKRN